jgi:hypothetical protein
MCCRYFQTVDECIVLDTCSCRRGFSDNHEAESAMRMHMTFISVIPGIPLADHKLTCTFVLVVACCRYDESQPALLSPLLDRIP